MALVSQLATVGARLQDRTAKHGVVEQPSALVSSPILFGHFDEDGCPGVLHARLRAAPRLSHGRKT